MTHASRIGPLRKWAHRLGWLAIAAALAGWVGFQYLASSLPQTAGVIAVPGIRAPADIVRDRDGVPHIYARSPEDASFALGFAHAQDRLWQMEVNRRVGQARLSELFGPASLDTDRFLRTLGIYRHAQASLAHLDERTRAVFQAYADGVNAFLESSSKPLPPEFWLLGHRPEPWQPADSLAWIKMMAWDLSRSWRDELLRLQLSATLTPEEIAELLAPYPGDPPLRLPDLKALYAGLQAPAAAILARAPEQLPEAAGSNNWVVSGARTTSGRPLLANDPHLPLTTPAVWYFAHLEAPGLRLIGATLPGVPMVVLGRSDRVAWGFTNTGPDVQDLYVERLDPGDPGRYVTPDGARPFEVREEMIRVKGAPDVRLRARHTRHGPVISDALPDVAKTLPAGVVLSFAWTALSDDDLTPRALVRMGLARGWDEFVEAARDFHGPQQNIVFADIEGNIGFLAPARVPIRRPDNDLKGLAPSPGWDARYDWQGFVPYDELPRALNPPEGVIATANDKIVSPEYPHWLGAHWHPPFRVNRIRERLSALPLHDADSFGSIQADTVSIYMREILPLLLERAGETPATAAALEALRRWDYDLRPLRPEPLIAEAWIRELSRLICEDELGQHFPRHWAERPLFMLNVLRDEGGQSRWCDDRRTAVRESCDQRIAQALEGALGDLRARYGDDMRKWRWGDAHVAVSEHRPLSGAKALAGLFELRAPAPGDTWTINVGRVNIADETNPFHTRHAASLRAIYDLSAPDRSRYVHSTGQSGNPFSPFYRNMNPMWSRVEYLTMSMDWADIGRNRLGTLRLSPAAIAPGR